MAKKKLPKKVITQVKEYKKILQADKLPVKDVYVFGSYAKGNQHKWSDIDVCVVSPRFKNAWNALTYLRRKVPNGLEWLIEPVGFSPKDFNDKYSTLIYEIKTYGVKV
jgi:predicted nucleotidyltransferase